jgi:hypothetical protein
MGNFTIVLLVGVFFFLFIYSISPIGCWNSRTSATSSFFKRVSSLHGGTKN